MDENCSNLLPGIFFLCILNVPHVLNSAVEEDIAHSECSPAITSSHVLSYSEWVGCAVLRLYCTTWIYQASEKCMLLMLFVQIPPRAMSKGSALVSIMISIIFVLSKKKDWYNQPKENTDVLERKPTGNCTLMIFILVGRSRGVKIRCFSFPSHYAFVVVVFVQADKTLISWGFWSHWTAPTWPQSENTRRGQRSQSDVSKLLK